jgi:L-fuculose-phosphate aldolase
VRIDTLTEELIGVGNYLATRGFHGALAGNISARLDGQLFICTRHGADKEALSQEDFVVCNFNGQKVSGKGSPTSEVKMHLAAYRCRKDIRAVVHAHPVTATAFAATSTPLRNLVLPEMIVLLGPVALVPYATPGTKELGRNLSAFLKEHDAFLLESHGALTLGESPRQAAYRMELLEQYAKITLLAKQLGPLHVLSLEDKAELSRLRSLLGSWG